MKRSIKSLPTPPLGLRLLRREINSHQFVIPQLDNLTCVSDEKEDLNLIIIIIKVQVFKRHHQLFDT